MIEDENKFDDYLFEYRLPLGALYSSSNPAPSTLDPDSNTTKTLDLRIDARKITRNQGLKAHMKYINCTLLSQMC